MIDESPANIDFVSPRIPDGDRHWLAVGASQAFGESLSADLGLAYAFFSDLKIRNSGALPEDLFRGSLAADFATDAYAASLRLRYKF
jgi:long-chain fatty acid transport protein